MLKAPFPYFGGKARIAPLVWDMFGTLTTYVEPFAGSLAVLLANPRPAKRETVGDTHAAVCNFWRAVRADPEGVAHHAVHPTIHDDLTARHRWLVRYFAAHHARFRDDPDYYDVQAAGWWCWGLSLWIGGNFCDYQGGAVPSDGRPYNSPLLKGAVHNGNGVMRQRVPTDARPLIQTYVGNGAGGTGAGLNAQRQLHDKRPEGGGGKDRGVSAQRGLDDRRPYQAAQHGSRGVNAQAVPELRTPDQRRTGSSHAAHLDAVTAWLSDLADRLFRVVVVNRPWDALLSPTVLGSTPTAQQHGPVSTGVFLDPPYATTQRTGHLYASDAAGDSHDTARAAYEWARAHGEEYRIAYCMAEQDWEIPDGWTAHERTFRSSRVAGADSRRRRDVVMFSPACLAASGTQQLSLFGDG